MAIRLTPGERRILKVDQFLRAQAPTDIPDLLGLLATVETEYDEFSHVRLPSGTAFSVGERPAGVPTPAG